MPQAKRRATRAKSTPQTRSDTAPQEKERDDSPERENDRNDTAAEPERSSGGQSYPDPVMPSLPGQPIKFDTDDAFAFTGETDSSGRTVSEGERERTAVAIEEAVRANTAWRSTLPLPAQLAMIGTPVVSAPGEEE